MESDKFGVFVYGYMYFGYFVCRVVGCVVCI